MNAPVSCCYCGAEFVASLDVPAVTLDCACGCSVLAVWLGVAAVAPACFGTIAALAELFVRALLADWFC
jgi:hypothetical protein